MWITRTLPIMHRNFQLIGLFLGILGLGSAYAQMTPQQQQQLPESNPNSAHYHTRYMPALGASQSENKHLQDRFGAFAMSEGSGWSGWSVDGESKAMADLQAIAQCQDRSSGADDCEVVISFKNQCGSVVGGDDHAGLGTAGTLRRARQLATERCNELGPGCKVFWEGCSYPAPAE